MLMMGITASSKKELKTMVGQEFEPIETSMFGNEYNGDGKYCVVGPDPYRARKYFAEVEVKDGLIFKVK